MPPYQNLTETIVERALREYLRHEPNACICETCLADMAAAALNRLTPRYYTTARGAKFLASDEQNLDFVSDLVGAVKLAVDRVMAEPRHDFAPRNGHVGSTPQPDSAA